jgi:hypothetical protein
MAETGCKKRPLLLVRQKMNLGTILPQPASFFLIIPYQKVIVKGAIFQAKGAISSLPP